MTQINSGTKGHFWQRLKHKLVTRFTNFLSIMANSFLAHEACLSYRAQEGAKFQKEEIVYDLVSDQVMPSKLRFKFIGGQLWLSWNSLEVTLHAKPAGIPVGMVKVLDVLQRSIQRSSVDKN